MEIGDCLKETEETEYWRELLGDSSCVPEATMAELLDETRQLIAIFTALDKRSKDGLPFLTSAFPARPCSTRCARRAITRPPAKADRGEAMPSSSAPLKEN
jgi:hypothetical protein